MKNLYFSLLAIITFTFANAQIINFPDANFKAKLLQADSNNEIAQDLTFNYFKIDSNNNGEIEMSEAQNVYYLNISNSAIFSIDGISNFVNLHGLHAYNNGLTNIDELNSMTNLYYIDCTSNYLSHLLVVSLYNLEDLYCGDNPLTNLYLTPIGAPFLHHLDYSNTQLSNFDFSGYIHLTSLGCSQNNISSLDLSTLINLQSLYCSGNNLSNLDLSSLTHLNEVDCSNNNLTNIDINQYTTINRLNCNNNQLTNLSIKNNNSTWYQLSFSGNPNLQYICADDEDITLVQQKIIDYNYTNCHVNSYCSFTPGGTFYTIQGNARFDFNNNGCDANDGTISNLKYTISDGTNNAGMISNNLGNYFFDVQAGTHTFSPQLENPIYFTISPTTATVSFPTTASPFTQNFCVTANGVHHDLETVIIPITAARPGFDASYKIKYKNKGNQVETASISFNYNDNILDFVSTSVTPTSQNTGVLNWNLGTLNPFQQGEILVTLNLNSPTETPPLNAGNVLDYISTISSGNTDETPYDNTSTLNQNVVNSYDPNDKTCIEGNALNPTIIGQYLHYMIRFENNGTAAAQNIVVKDMIDTTKFDVSTLQMTDASHTCFTRINGNKVEFIFENINLDFNDATNDGFVVFKIKLISTLPTSSQITNTANIYFDYNFPITTNTATSNFIQLQNNSFDFDNYFTLYPIPAKDILTISNKQNATISSISIYNTLGQVVITSTNPSETIDVSSLKTGNYFIKIVSEKGISSSKFIKE